MSALEEAQAEMERVAAEAAALAQELTSTELERSEGFSVEAAAEMKARMLAVKARLNAKQREMVTAQDAMKQEMRRVEDTLRDVMRQSQHAMSLALAPIKKMVERMQEGIETMSLYLGTGERIVTIREGERAAATEPIVIRQMVLAMDEETGLLSEQDGINADRVDAFDEWLLASPQHVDQIVPEQRCVVAVVPRWTPRTDEQRYDDPRPEDKLTHFVIRNGDALFRTSVQFRAGDVLIPRGSEFAEFFYKEEFDFESRKSERVALKPGSREYEAAMERSDKRGRHYMRIGLILQGLVDRTEIFHPLHPAGINMLTDPAERSEKVRIIVDAEGGLGSGRQSFADWQTEMAAQLRVGMRVVGAFDGQDFRDVDRGYEGSHERLWPSGFSAEFPDAGVPYLLETRKDDGGLVFRYARHGKVYSYWRVTEAKRRISCTVYPSDRFVLPYDLVDSAVLRGFLSERRNRREYQSLWPLLKTVMFAKQKEEAAEAPFRLMLAGILARDNDVAVTEAQDVVPDLVRWYKLSNKYHRPLAGTEFLPADEERAVRMISGEFARRLKDQKRRVNPDVLARLREAHPDFLVIARPRNGTYIVLVAADERDVYVHERTYSARGGMVDARDWVLVGGARAARWTILTAGSRWEGWDRTASSQDHLTGPEQERLVRQLHERHEAKDRPVMMISQTERDGDFYAWLIKTMTEFDPEHPLTEHCKEVVQEYQRVRWHRKGNGPPSLARHPADRGSYTLVDGLPWRGEFAGHKAQLVLWTNETSIERFHEERRRYVDAQAFARPLEVIAERAKESMRVAWARVAIEKARAGFLVSGHEEDWPAELGRLERKGELSELSWPYGRRQWSSHSSDRSRAEQSIDIALEAGVWVDGMTVAEVFDVAVKAGLRGAWSNGKYGSWQPDAMPVLEDDVATLVVSTAELVVVDDEEYEEEIEPDEVIEEDASEFVGDITNDLLGKLASALQPKAKDDPVVLSTENYDVLDAK